MPTQVTPDVETLRLEIQREHRPFDNVRANAPM